MPINLFPIVNGSDTKWGDISGTLSDQSDLQDELDAKAPMSHVSDNENPHNVDKMQVGLGNVTNDSQLKRSAGDINSFQEKTSPDNNDIVLIEDSSDGNNKKKVTIDDLFLRMWVDLDGTFLNSSSFTFSGTNADRKMLEGSLFTCTNSSGTVRRVGYISSTSGDAGTVTANVIVLSSLEAGDKDFKSTPNRKFWDYVHLISLPGELVADANNSQGTWLLDVPYLAWLLAVDIKVRTAAAGSGASCAINLYRESTPLFGSSLDLMTQNAMRNVIPNSGTYLGSVNQYDNISMRITGVGGASTKPADLQLKSYIVPQNLFTAHE